MKCDMNREKNMERFLESANEALLESKRLYRRTELLSARCAALVRNTGGTGNDSRELEVLWKLLEEERVRELEATRLEMKCYREVEAFIDLLERAEHRMILRRRYLDMGLTWVQIQQRMANDGQYFSERQIYRLYKAAMAEAQKIWNSRR